MIWNKQFTAFFDWSLKSHWFLCSKIPVYQTDGEPSTWDHSALSTSLGSDCIRLGSQNHFDIAILFSQHHYNISVIKSQIFG